jgi:hypothetical protein
MPRKHPGLIEMNFRSAATTATTTSFKASSAVATVGPPWRERRRAANATAPDMPSTSVRTATAASPNARTGTRKNWCLCWCLLSCRVLRPKSWRATSKRTRLTNWHKFAPRWRRIRKRWNAWSESLNRQAARLPSRGESTNLSLPFRTALHEQRSSRPSSASRALKSSRKIWTKRFQMQFRRFSMNRSTVWQSEPSCINRSSVSSSEFGFGLEAMRCWNCAAVRSPSFSLFRRKRLRAHCWTL